MLQELSIKNFAIIENLQVSFDEGMTVLTGETGAGKSIIIDAVGLLAGGRGSNDLIRYGENKTVIQGLFSICKTPRQFPCWSHTESKQTGTKFCCSGNFPETAKTFPASTVQS